MLDWIWLLRSCANDVIDSRVELEWLGPMVYLFKRLDHVALSFLDDRCLSTLRLHPTNLRGKRSKAGWNCQIEPT